MKNLFVIIFLLFSYLASGQEDAIKILTNQTELKKCRKEFKSNKFTFQSKRKNYTVFDRYSNGNRILIDSISIILRSKNIEQRRLLINSMLERSNFVFDKELQNVIYENLNCDDTNIIWLIGKNKFNNFVNYFENKLSQFPITCQQELLYWLGVDGNSEKGFSILKNLLLSTQIDHYEFSRLQDALYSYMNSPNENIRNISMDLAIEIYSKKIIYNNLLKYDEYFAKDFENTFLFNLLNSGDQKIIPIAKILYEQKKHEESALIALVKNDHKAYRDEFINRLKNDSYDYVGLNVSPYYIKISSDLSIIPLIIDRYFKSKPHNCARFFLDNNLEKELEISLKTMNDNVLVESIKEEIIIRKKSAGDVTKDLYNFGILKAIDTLIFSKKILDYQSEIQFSIPDQILRIEPYSFLLHNTPICYSYERESSEFPIKYDEILYNALKLSEKELGIAEIYSVSKPNDDFSKANHEIFADFGEIGFKANHTSTSLYADSKFIIEFLNKFPTIKNSKKKFFHDFISESNIIFYTDEAVYKNFSEYLKRPYRY